MDMEDGLATAECLGTLALRGTSYDLAVRATAEQLHLRLEDAAAGTVRSTFFHVEPAGPRCPAARPIHHDGWAATWRAARYQPCEMSVWR